MTLSDSNPAESAPAIAFAEAGSAVRLVSVKALLPEKVAVRLSALLARSAAPDAAVLQLEMLLHRHPETARQAFRGNEFALRAVVALFSSSRWLGQTLLQNPDLLQLFTRPAALAAASDAERFHEQFARFRMLSHDVPLPHLLARFKRREYVRIFCRELLELASVAEVTAEISALSDVLIEHALLHCENEMHRLYQGWPQLRSSDGRAYRARFAVLALGKLGGNELNYSSDIDLLYLYDDAEDSHDLAVSAREFFTRLAQELTSVLSAVSAEGQVFRVDLRLRPQGASGEMVVGCAQALRYYRAAASDWELQALLKLRTCAGDRTLAQEFISEMETLIYRHELKLEAVRTAAHSLERIRLGTERRATAGLDVKNAAGGIREIEFAVQCLQRVYGGAEPWLRSSGTMFALQKLNDKGHISDAAFRELCETYVLLRSIEHRLQCAQGLQLHRLPDSAAAQAALWRSLGRMEIAGVAELKRRMEAASNLCAEVLRLGADEAPAKVDPEMVGLRTRSAERLMEELAACSAGITQALAADVYDPARRNLVRFLAAASTDEERIAGTLHNASAVERALPVLAQSAMATDILARHPEDICALFAADAVACADADHLRIAARRAVLRCLGRSLLERQTIWEIYAKHSRAFDGILQQAFALAEAPPNLAVFALGRLGTGELDVVSDADLLFVRGPEGDAEAAERAAHTMVSMLAGYTREGSVIAVDTRLRPRGREGELVVSTRQLAQYFELEASAWEALAYAKLRRIAGSKALDAEVSAAVQSLRRRHTASGEFAAQLRRVRRRLEEAGPEDSFKNGTGGLYDVDYTLGMLEARAGLQTAGRQIPQRLAELASQGLLMPGHESELLRAAELFRGVDHAIRVAEGRSRRRLPESDELLATVERLSGHANLRQLLRESMSHLRSIFELYFHD